MKSKSVSQCWCGLFKTLPLQGYRFVLALVMRASVNVGSSLREGLGMFDPFLLPTELPLFTSSPDFLLSSQLLWPLAVAL